MSRKGQVLVVVMIAVAAAALLIWRNQEARATAAKLESEILKGLNAEEIDLIIKSQLTTDPGTVVTMRQSAEARQVFLKKLRGTFSLAAEGRREGLAEDQNFKINFEYKKSALLQVLYSANIGKEQVKALVTPETMQAVWDDAENEARFNREIDALRAIQKVYAQSRDSVAPAPRPEGEKLEKARKEWAVTKILSDKAKADAEFMGRPEIALRFRILGAGILAADYANKHWQKRIKATNEEINAYLADHPEYDLAKKRERADMVLRRALSGEDFGKLAAEFSEDRSTKNKGGLYENVGKDVLWAEVERVALNLNKGQTADAVIESHNGFHIVKLENRNVTNEKNGGQSVKLSVRHIMFQKAFEEPNNNRPGIPPPFMKPEEIAKAEVEKEKYEAVVADLILRNQISLPDDFVVRLPEDLEKGLTEDRTVKVE
jgi:hypothetical protein